MSKGSPKTAPKAPKTEETHLDAAKSQLEAMIKTLSPVDANGSLVRHLRRSLEACKDLCK